MYYAKQIDENGKIVALHSLSVPFPAESAEFIPITEAEYLTLMEELVPTNPDEIPDSEALSIITGGAV